MDTDLKGNFGPFIRSCVPQGTPLTRRVQTRCGANLGGVGGGFRDCDEAKFEAVLRPLKVFLTTYTHQERTGDLTTIFGLETASKFTSNLPSADGMRKKPSDNPSNAEIWARFFFFFKSRFLKSCSTPKLLLVMVAKK